MLPIAGKTAGPNELIFFVDTLVAGRCLRLKKTDFFYFQTFFIFFFHGQRRALQLVYTIYIVIEILQAYVNVVLI